MRTRTVAIVLAAAFVVGCTAGLANQGHPDFSGIGWSLPDVDVEVGRGHRLDDEAIVPGGRLGWTLAGEISPPPTPALSPRCLPRGDVVDNLARKYGEEPRWYGLDGRGAILELFASSSGNRTWTLIRTTAVGCTMMIGAGRDWEELMGAGERRAEPLRPTTKAGAELPA